MDAETPGLTDADAAKAFRDLLNAHGYGFQYRVLKECQDFQVKDTGSRGRWSLRAAELPVVLNGQDFHIDGVLEFVTPDRALHILAVVECTRVDPAYARWCFVKDTAASAAPMLDAYRVGADGSLIAKTAWLDGGAGNLMELGLDLRTTASGPDGTKSLDDAMRRVRRGASGLAERLPEWIRDAHPVLVVPVIITTAALFTTETRLDDSDLLSGDVGDTPLKFSQWLWYGEHVSRSLLPRVSREFSIGTQNPINESLEHEHRRAVVVASASGLKSALTKIAVQTLAYR